MSSDAYRRYMLTVLLATAAFNYMDRAALGLLLQEIKVDLNLSDTQLGFLTGIAFAAFYAVMGIPIARWADRGNRVTIISASIALCSGAVALCGVAVTFAQLLLVRVGVAIGEAGCVPPAHSLIADYFSRTERPRAVSIYKLGLPLSTILGYFFAGWLNELVGWRMTFILLGLPGLGVAMIAWFTLREPRVSRPLAISASPSKVADHRDSPSGLEVWATLWRNRTFRNMLLGYAFGSFFSNGISQWKAAFFIRSHGLQTGELGTWFAALWGLGGLLGVYLGGYLASRYASNNERLQLRAMALIYCGFGVLSVGVYSVSNVYLALGLMGVSVVGVSMAIGPLFATIQTIVPEQMRAMSIAIIFLFANLIGLGFGPLVAGVLSDFLRAWTGDESLRYALLALCPGYLLTGWFLWRAGRSVGSDVIAADDYRVGGQVAK